MTRRPVRVRVWSDLHLEMRRNANVLLPLPPVVDADVVILAGDIGNGANGVQWAATTFPDTPVAYVLGNHENYHGDIDATLDACRRAAEGTTVRVLEQDSWDIAPGVRLLGATLWTDLDLWGDWGSRTSALDAMQMNDFHLITHAGQRFTPEAAIDLHDATRTWLHAELARASIDEVRTIVVTHHAPHVMCLGPAFVTTRDSLSPCFASDLSELLIGPMPPFAWVSGHTHANYVGQVGQALLVSNQAGYRFRGECQDFVPEGVHIDV